MTSFLSIAPYSPPGCLAAMKYHVGGRLLLLTETITKLAKAIFTGILGIAAKIAYWLTFGAFQDIKLLSQRCSSSCIDNMSMAWNAFSSLLVIESYARKAFASKHPFEPRKDQLTPAVRNHRLRDADHVEKSLATQIKRAADQEEQAGSAFKDHEVSEIFPGTEKERVGPYQAGISHHIGKRDEMEDEHLTASIFLKVGGKRDDAQLFGIFDGHGGGEASRYVARHLTKKFQETVALLEPFFTRLKGENGVIWNALKITCVSLHDDLEKQGITAGTTATVALIFRKKLWTMNVGDSRIILSDGTQLTEDAKPTNSYYAQGIANRGGSVHWGRVRGRLAVGRAIGDIEVRGMNPRPKITMRPLPNTGHLILACDGIWDVAGSKQAAKLIRDHSDKSPDELAQGLVISAFCAGSRDNLSAMVVPLATV